MVLKSQHASLKLLDQNDSIELHQITWNSYLNISKSTDLEWNVDQFEVPLFEKPVNYQLV